jgi:chromosome segregation ATPase
MNLQEAINELEKGHRTFKAFEFLLDIAKTVQNSQKEFKASEMQIMQTKAILEGLHKDKETASQEIKDLKAEAKKIIDDAKIKAEAAADKITSAAQAELLKTQEEIAQAQGVLQKTRVSIDDLAKDKAKLTSELDEINGQIDLLKTNLKKLMGG